MDNEAERAGAPRPALSRRHSAGAESARGLLLTVLGEFVLPTGGSAWTAAFIEVFARLGIAEKAIRQALARTAAAGWIDAERVGRRTRWRLTEAGDRLLTEGTERIYAFAGSQSGWDGRWLLVVLARPQESDRAARHLLRTRLSWAGFGSPAPGVWVSTHTERKHEVEHVLHQAGVAGSQVFIAEHGAGELADLTTQSWDLPAIERQYEQFLADFASPAAGDPLARLTELVHAWRRFPAIDPGLPGELLPAGWTGTKAADLFAARHAGWSHQAVRHWRELNHDQELAPAGAA